MAREDIGGQLLAKMGVDKERMALSNSGVILAKMLQANRIDLWAYGVPVIMYVARLQTALEQVKASGKFGKIVARYR